MWRHSMRVSNRFERMRSAPVDTINALRLSLEASGHEILNLGQAIPDLTPPVAAIEALHSRVSDRTTHAYTVDQGLPVLREELVVLLRNQFDAAACTVDRLIVTAGANHAFLIACMTLLEPGHNVGLLSPYFLNHQMIVRGCGGNAVELLLPSYVADVTIKMAEDLITRSKLRMIVIVNPSNPSGKVLSDISIKNLILACKRHNVFLVADEVYRMFVPEHSRFTSAAGFATDGDDDNIIVLGSFSKEFGMSGWRVGWLLCPSRLVKHLMKAQDLSIICAPHISQELALLSLRVAPVHARTKLKEYASRRKLVLTVLEQSGLFEIDTGEGAFFAWFRPLREVESEIACSNLMVQSGVCMMPGTLFGEAWRSWFRLSYGNTPIEQLDRGLRNIISYFNSANQ